MNMNHSRAYAFILSNNVGDFDGNEPNGRATSYIRREPARKGNDDSEELLLIYENSADDPVKAP